MNNLWYLNKNITYTNLPMSNLQKSIINEKTVNIYFRQSLNKPVKKLIYSMKEAML